MSVPDFQSVMLPLLRLTSDGKEQFLGDVVQLLAEQMQLSEEDRRKLLPSGRQLQFDNRVAWAVTYLVKAKLLERTGRGRFRITERGNALLADNPPEINIRLLLNYPEFQEFRETSKTEGESREQIETPEEALESSYEALRSSLAQELLDKVKRCPPRFFERLVVDLLVAMGYGGSRADAGQAVGQSGDGGIDGIIKEDRLGLDVVYIQAKRWEGTVGRPAVQAFAGSLEGHRARKGVLITTSQFTSDAIEYVNRIEKRIILIDGEQLSEHMIDANIGVTPITSYEVKRIDSDYFPDADQ